MAGPERDRVLELEDALEASREEVRKLSLVIDMALHVASFEGLSLAASLLANGKKYAGV